MTEYQKIENALIPLGWTPEMRNGDHIRFTQEGNPHAITVPYTLTDKGRAVKNTYADIRRVEPRFPLGRQTHMLLRQADEPKPEAPPEGIPAWMTLGSPVRWTKPEGRDWSKLDDRDSLMNQEYVVCGYQHTDDGILVLIGKPHEGKPFPVFTDDLDTYRLEQCGICRKKVPASQIIDDPSGKRICPDCRDLLDKRMEEKENPKKPDEKPSNWDHVEKMIANSNFPEDRKKKYLKIADYAKMDISQVVDMEEYTRIKEEARAAFQSLSSRDKKSLRKMMPEIAASLEREESEPTNPNEAWQMAREEITFFACANRKDFTEEFLIQTRNKVFRTIYQLKPMLERGQKKNKAANLITVTTGDWETTHLFWKESESLHKHFKASLPDLPLFILLHCPKEKFRQYIIHEEDYDAALELLRRLVPKNDEECLSRARLDRYLPDIKELRDTLRDALTANGIDTSDYQIHLSRDISETDVDTFETAAPIYTGFIRKNTPGPAKEYDKAVEAVKSLGRIDAPLELDVIQPDGRKHKHFKYAYSFPDGPFKGGGAKETFTPLFGISVIRGGGEDRFAFTGHAEGIGNAEAETLLREALDNLAHTSFAPAFRDAFGAKEAPAETQQEEQQETASMTPQEPEPTPAPAEAEPQPQETPNEQNPQDMDKILENTNPTSPDPKAGELTTLALLQELKRRGVEFQNLTITVKASLSLDEI